MVQIPIDVLRLTTALLMAQGGCGAQKSSCSRHEDLTFKLHSNHECRPAPSPPGSGSGIRYIPTPDGADREGYYNPHILLNLVDLATSTIIVVQYQVPVAHRA